MKVDYYFALASMQARAHAAQTLAGRFCTEEEHFGRPLRAAVYAAAGPGWEGFADCSNCGSTVLLTRFVGGAA